MPSVLLPEGAYRRLRELAEARGLNVEDLILSLAVENAGPEEAGRIYWEAAETLLAQAVEELAKGRLRQASEKIWGAAALAVKAVAFWREGRRLISHGELWAYVRKLVDESGDRELGRLWRSAISMHVNSYEGWATLEAVRDALEDVRELLEKLRCPRGEAGQM